MTRRVRIDLVFDADCPHIDQARAVLRSALEELGTGETPWTEWDRGSGSTPREYRHFGSPTVLVNGRDVASDDDGRKQSDGDACRLYVDEAGDVTGAPPKALIVAAIRRAGTA